MKHKPVNKNQRIQKELNSSGIIVLPIKGEGEIPKGWRLMWKVEVSNSYDQVMEAVEGMAPSVSIRLHEDDWVLSNIQLRSRRNIYERERTEVKFSLRVKRIGESIDWMLLQKIPEKKALKKRPQRMVNLTFMEILDYNRNQLIHTLGPHPAEITLSYLSFSTGTYIEDHSFFTKPVKHEFLKDLIRKFRVFLDFQTKQYAMHEVVGALCRQTRGTFSFPNTRTREYSKTSEGFLHCVTLNFHPEGLIDPDFPAFEESFRFYIMSKEFSVRWFPSNGLSISANNGESEHFLKWTLYDCDLKDEDCVTRNKDVYSSSREKYGRVPAAFLNPKETLI